MSGAYPEVLVDVVAAALTDHVPACKRDGCGLCRSWRTRARRVLVALARGGRLVDAGRTRRSGPGSGAPGAGV